MIETGKVDLNRACAFTVMEVMQKQLEDERSGGVSLSTSELISAKQMVIEGFKAQSKMFLGFLPAAEFCYGICGSGVKFSGKSVGIIGLGRIGSAIAKRAEAFGCFISYHSRSEKPLTNYKYYSSIINLARDSQILFIACALTEETRHIVNHEVINALGPKGVLINIGRGQHIDESELVAALLEGRLGGAGLDVFENEPEVPEQLFGLENVVLVPHVGSDTVETSNAMADLVIGNLEAHFCNKPLLTPVHPATSDGGGTIG